MGNEFNLRMADTNEKVTVRLYEDCMDIIDKDGFKTTLFKDTIIDANIERETHSETHDPGKVRVGARIVPGVYVSKSIDMSYVTSYTIVKLRIKSVIDDLVLVGSEEELKDILRYCVSKRRNISKKESKGYYAWLVSGYITLASWIGFIITSMYQLSNEAFLMDTATDLYGWFVLATFLSSPITYFLFYIYGDSKPEVKYPEK